MARMRLVPKDQDWTVYAWLVYLLFFLLAGWTSHLPATAAATAVALVLYFLQLTLNFAWSLIFFSRHLIDVALLDIAALGIAILATTIAFFRADRVAGFLMLPYLAWVSFAAALNWEIVRLN